MTKLDRVLFAYYRYHTNSHRETGMCICCDARCKNNNIMFCESCLNIYLTFRQSLKKSELYTLAKASSDFADFKYKLMMLRLKA